VLRPHPLHGAGGRLLRDLILPPPIPALHKLGRTAGNGSLVFKHEHSLDLGGREEGVVVIDAAEGVVCVLRVCGPCNLGV
jgi:hypothetical protein